MSERFTPNLQTVRFWVLFTFSLILLPLSSFSQSYTDGPIELQLKLREINTTFAATDEALLGVGFAPDELSYFIWGQDNANLDAQGWVGGTCLQQDFVPPQLSMDFNTVFYSYTYAAPTVPQFFDLRFEAFEDDLPSDALLGFCNSGSRCVFNGSQCCGVILFGTCVGITTGDDEHCVANPFITGMDYRLGTPCSWYDHGFISGGCTRYQPKVESFWRYTKGTSCGNAIDLGNVAPGFTTVTHFNSNECYSNNYAGSPGNDVYYEINVTQSVGLRAFLCGVQTTFDTYIYFLDNTCTSIDSNDDFCGTVSEFSRPVCNNGTYYIVVDGATAAAMGTFTLTIEENVAVMVAADAGPDRDFCIGSNSVIGGAPTGSSGGGGYTYSWSPATGLNNPGIANPVAAPLVNTQYIITVTDINNCSAQDTVDITVHPLPAPNLGPDVGICSGTSTTLVAAGPCVGNCFYNWFPPGLGNNQAVIANSIGLYIVFATDSNMCTGSDTINVTASAEPHVDLGPDTNICLGTNLLLDASPGMTTYSWTGPIISAMQTINVTTAGTYVVSVDSAGCTTVDSIQIGIDPLPLPNLGNDTTICITYPLQLDPGAGFSGYSWSTSSVNQMITVSTADTFSVTVMSIDGCFNSDSIIVSTNPLPVVNLGPDTNICEDILYVLDAQNVGATYQWNIGGSAQTHTVASSGNYAVLVTDVNNCAAADTAMVTLDSLPIINIGPDTAICPGMNYTLDAGAAAGYTYVWMPGGAVAQTLLVPASGNYMVTVTDGNNCEGTDDAEIILVDPLNVSLPAATQFCEFGTAELDPGPGPGPGLVQYIWSPGGSLNQTIIIDQPGVYSVIVTDQYGCADTLATNVTFASNFINDLFGGDTTVCPGEFVVVDAGEGFLTYAWSNGSNDQFVQVSMQDTLYVDAIDTSGCMHSDTIVIEMLNPPILEPGDDQYICPNQDIELQVSSGFQTYSWYESGAPGTQLSSTNMLTITSSGIYLIDVTWDKCELSADIEINDDCPEDILVPNVFSPNGDGLNDILLFSGQNIETFELLIFDRWGNEVFITDDIMVSWDGTLSGGGDAREGVYFFGVKYKFLSTDKIWEEDGSITLIR